MLSKQHIKILKRIKNNKLIRETKPNKDLDYLYENGYIEIIEYDKLNDYYAQPYLTEKGKAKLYSIRQNNLKFLIPLVISIIALICSFKEELILLLQ